MELDKETQAGLEDTLEELINHHGVRHVLDSIMIVCHKLANLCDDEDEKEKEIWKALKLVELKLLKMINKIDM